MKRDLKKDLELCEKRAIEAEKRVEELEKEKKSLLIRYTTLYDLVNEVLGNEETPNETT